MAKHKLRAGEIKPYVRNWLETYKVGNNKLSDFYDVNAILSKVVAEAKMMSQRKDADGKVFYYRHEVEEYLVSLHW